MARPKNGPAHTVKKSMALDALRRGESIHALHKRTKIARDTLVAWRDAAGIKPPAPVVPSKPAVEVSVNGEPKTATMERGPLAAALEAGKRATGEEPEPAAAAGEGKADAPPAGPPPPPPGVRLVQLTNALLLLGTKIACVASKVDFAKVADKAQLTDEEASQLMFTAPYAEPYVLMLVERLPIIAAVGFGVQVVMMVADRMKEVRVLAPEKPKPETKPEDVKPRPQKQADPEGVKLATAFDYPEKPNRATA